MLKLFIAAALAASVPSGGAGNTARTEAAYLRVPSAGGARASSQAIDARAHYPGSPGDYKLAVYMRDTMRKFGMRAWIEPFGATVYTPRVLQLQLLANPVVTFDLHDAKIAADPDGSRPDAGLPFNAGSGSGDVRAPLAYAGRGLEADYDTLERAGVTVRGRIALIRYGAEYRGNLAARAIAHGAAGVIFYSDPKDGGSAKGPVYPNGPYRPLGVVQRGDVMGDDHVPLSVPTLPVTGTTALALLADLRGTAGPSGWGGALPVAYRLGVTASPVRLHVEMDSRTTTLWNTVGEITGANPDQTVIMGAHRDAWVYGVSDDGSGIATLLEVARGLGALHRAGWKPARTIRIAGWDAEEIGELGSAAYVTSHRSELARGCVAYVNTDEAASGPTFGASAAAALVPFLQPVTNEVLHVARPRIDAPAGGSDFESFIYTTGTPIIDLGYNGPLGTYHSPYDDYRFTARFADPGFVHHVAIARIIGVIAIRLADAAEMPYRFVPYVRALNDGAKAMAKLAAPAKVVVGPALGDAIGRFERAARAYDANPRRNAADALKAVQRLDVTAYSANGYASVAFPNVALAIASGKQSDVDAAVAATATDLGSVTALLEKATH